MQPRRPWLPDGAVVTLALIAGLWLLGHQYRGVQCCDAELYAAQALSHIHPERYLDDIFFHYGSQDEFTLFSRLYAILIAATGLEEASRLMVIATTALWVCSSWNIAAVLEPPRRIAFMALLAGLPGAYAMHVLSYGEAAATARPFAEALILGAVAAALATRNGLAALLALAAATQHPLMAFGGISLLAIWHGLRSVRLAIAVALVMLAAFALGLHFTGLLERLLQPMDEEWFNLTWQRSTFIFISSWKLRDWNLLALYFCLLLAGWQRSRETPIGRLFLAGAVLEVLILLLQWIGVEWWHSQLLVQAQPYRAFWVVKWLALLAFAFALPTRSTDRRWFPLLVATAWFAQDNMGGIVAIAMLAAPNRPSETSPPPRLAWLLLGCAIFGWVNARLDYYYFEVLSTMPHAEEGPLLDDWTKLGYAALLVGIRDMAAVVAGAAAWALYVAWTTREDTAAPLIKSPILALFAFGACSSGLLLFLAFSAKATPYFAQPSKSSIPMTVARRIPESAVVYWQDNLPGVWFGLGRQSYYSFVQSGGVIYSREATMEMKRRADILATTLGGWDANWSFAAQLPAPAPATGIRAGLFALCRQEPVDFVILKTRFGDLQETEWRDEQKRTTWHLYDCSKMGKAATSQPSNAHDADLHPLRMKQAQSKMTRPLPAFPSRGCDYTARYARSFEPASNPQFHVNAPHEQT